MGVGNENEGLKNPGRCAKRGVTRVLQAEKWSGKLVYGEGVKQVITELATGKVVPEHCWKTMKGFEGKVMEVAVA
jgi:hypothetical protein